MRSILRSCRLTFESVTRHALRKREIDGHKEDVCSSSNIKLRTKHRSLLTCSLFYTTTKETNELRIRFVFPCNVTLKIEFFGENLALIMARVWRV